LGYPKYEILDGKMVLKQQSWRLGGIRFSEKPMGFFFGETATGRIHTWIGGKPVNPYRNLFLGIVGIVFHRLHGIIR